MRGCLLGGGGREEVEDTCHEGEVRLDAGGLAAFDEMNDEGGDAAEGSSAGAAELGPGPGVADRGGDFGSQVMGDSGHWGDLTSKWTVRRAQCPPQRPYAQDGWGTATSYSGGILAVIGQREAEGVERAVDRAGERIRRGREQVGVDVVRGGDGWR
jgi:hypothetical protein